MGRHSRPSSNKGKLTAVAVIGATGSIPILALPAQAAPTNTVWDRLAMCESSGNFSNMDTGGSGHYGGFQFSIATWQSVGGTGNPANATPAEQLLRAKRLLARSGPGQWECKVGLTQGTGASQGLTILGAGSANTPHTLDAGTDDRDPADVYTVRKGDTLSGIARANGISPWTKLYNANRDVVGANPNLIFPGQRLNVPGGGTPVGKEPSAPATSSKASRVVAYAKSKISSASYLWGGNGPVRFDCSGLTSQAWLSVGVSIPRTSQGQLAGLPRVSLSQIRPGDLVAYSFSSHADHVAMYVGPIGPGGANLIDTAGRHPGGGVNWSSMSTRGGTIAGVVRPS